MDKKTIDNVGYFLKSKDIKPSFQRIRIYEYLMNSFSHPTVDEIYKVLIGEIPTLSKTTVYNTLNLFIEKRIVHMMTIEEKTARYDADVSDHGHFKCDICGKVYDFDANIIELDTDLSESYSIFQRDVFFRGICPECNRKIKGGK